MPLRTLFVFCLLPLLLNSAYAQDAPLPPNPPYFPTLFKNPTGANGYEDWVQAGDLIQNNKALAAMNEEAGVTLTFKRQVLADPQIQQALHLLRQGLNKPVQAPLRLSVERATYPEFTGMRRLGQLLGLEIYVRLAEGNVDGAIVVLDEGLQFGQRTQGDVPLSGLLGLVNQAAVLSAFAGHLDQLSEYQCRRVQRIAEDWLETPSHAALNLTQRKLDMLRRLDNRRTDPDALLNVIKASVADSTGAEGDGLDTIRPYALQHPEDLAYMMSRAASLAARYYDAAIANLSLPVQKRVAVPFPQGDSPEHKLLAIMMSETSYSTNAYDALEAKVRLLGIHAAIHRYQWEYNRLPDRLADLHLGALNMDPFTDTGFLYKHEGNTYDLSSFGPTERNAQGKFPPVPTLPLRL